MTAAEFRDEVLALAKGLLAQGIRFGDRVAIMSRTRYEWTLFDFALWTIGARSCRSTRPPPPSRSAGCCTTPSAAAAIVEHEDHAMTIATVIDRLPQLRRLWQLDAGAVQELYDAGAHLDDEVVHRHRQAVTPDSVATIIYTSGTTGRPKGCVITHGNFMFEADTVIERWEPVFHSKRATRRRPCCSCRSRTSSGGWCRSRAIRGRVSFGHQPQLHAAALLPDLAAFRPTFFLAVPYIFEKVFNAARRKAEKEGRAGPFEKAVDVAVEYADAVEAKAWGIGPGPSAGLRMQHQLFDKLVYSKMRAAMGGRVRHAMSGGSAMDRRLGLFFAGAGVQSTRATASPRRRRRRPPTRPSAPATARSASRSPA